MTRPTSLHPLRLTPLAALASCLIAAGARAQPDPTPPQPAPPAPPAVTVPPAPAPMSDQPEPLQDIAIDEWKSNDWQLLPPKQTSLVELDGYLRLRMDMFRKLNFDNGFAPANSSPETAEPFLRGTPTYPASSEGQADFTGANMRMRITPTINITDNVSIISTFDVLDNIVMGSTPRSLAAPSGEPLNILSPGQISADEGFRHVGNAIKVRRLYGRLTALGEQLELRFGRMPDHFGLGMVANDGDCLDCDFGTVTDRISATVNIAEHLITPMFDWVSSGPVVNPYGMYGGGQELDAATFDDADQYGLRLERIDAPAKIAEMVVQGQSVLNYGVWAFWRRQDYDFPQTYWRPAEEAPGTAEQIPTAANQVERDADIFFGDAYLRWFYDGIELSFEGAIMGGTFKDRVGGGIGAASRTTRVLQGGGVMDLAYRFAGDYDGLKLRLRGGGASFDRGEGFGALGYENTQRGGGDLTLNNFQLNPAYHVDLLLFRRIIGTVTESWYVAPAVSYEFDNSITGAFQAMYAQAMDGSSVPGNKTPMGVELNAALTYGMGQALAEDGFKAGLFGGVLFPLGAFENQQLPEDERGASVVWTVQGRLYLTF